MKKNSVFAMLVALAFLFSVVIVFTDKRFKIVSSRAVHHKENEMKENLEKCVGMKISEAIIILGVSKSDRVWIDEPPGILRGASYTIDGGSICIYLAKDDRLFRQFSGKFEWDYNAFVDCHVGGVVYRNGEHVIKIGPDIPLH